MSVRCCWDSPVEISSTEIAYHGYRAVERQTARCDISPPLLHLHPFSSPLCEAAMEQDNAPDLPQANRKWMEFENGRALGTWQLWRGGQYCSILTEIGIVGCGIYDLETPAEFGQAIAIAKGTPDHPLTYPEDLLEASIVGVTPQAAALGIQPGQTGRQAVERMLAAARSSTNSAN
ncbi:MAG: DUF1805 domain-containing protein [Planctomycetota bacterium]|nr:MAG: DUF1805 domain-containing protein [Planctomycetota bacterium]